MRTSGKRAGDESFFFFFSFLFLNKMGRAISLLRRHSRRLGSCQPTLPLPPNRSRSSIIKKQDDVHFGPALLLRRETGESRKAVHAVVCNSDRIRTHRWFLPRKRPHTQKLLLFVSSCSQISYKSVDLSMAPDRTPDRIFSRDKIVTLRDVTFA